MEKIMFVFGTRPEAIKLAPVILEVKKRKRFEPIVVVTAQHREMLDQVLSHFNIEPDIDLDLMQPDQSLFEITAKAIRAFEKILKDANPDLILVQGDTTSTFVGSLAAFYRKIRIGHVEAGLRTGDKYAPFPEEMNRKMVSVLADYHFAPTETNRKHLLNEGVASERICVTGNTVIDALFMTVDKEFDFPDIELSKYRKTVLITAHRRENFGVPFESICLAIRELARTHNDVLFVYPVHLNPNVQEPVYRILSGLPNVRLIPPMEYHSFANLMAKIDLILTDSGGIQEEAPSLGKPVLVLRNETERPEAVTAGTVQIVGTEKSRIIESTTQLLTDPEVYKKMASAINPYGDGKASGRIVDFLVDRQ